LQAYYVTVVENRPKSAEYRVPRLAKTDPQAAARGLSAIAELLGTKISAFHNRSSTSQSQQHDSSVRPLRRRHASLNKHVGTRQAVNE